MVRPSAFPMFENEMLRTGKCMEIGDRRAYSKLCKKCPNALEDGRCYLEEIEYHGLFTRNIGEKDES